MPSNNADNLIPQNKRTKAEQSAIGAMGGIASGKARREKKAIRDILNDYLDKDIQGNVQYEQLAKKLGIDDTKSIKDVFTIVCVMNTLKKANLSDLELMQRLLGEDTVKEENNGILNELAEYLKGDK